MRDKKGMAGLTDQFPISPSRPEVIRSSCTWREAWIPLGFISSNYPLLPPHAVPSLHILYFSSGSWHCPLLSPSSSTLPPVVLHSHPHCEFHPIPKSSAWLIYCNFSVFLSLFGHCPHVNPRIPAEGHSDVHTQIHILLLLLVDLSMKRPLQLLSNSAEGSIRQLPPLFFF